MTGQTYISGRRTLRTGFRGAICRLFAALLSLTLSAGVDAQDDSLKIPGFGIAAPATPVRRAVDDLEDNKKPITFGIVPQHAAAREAEIWLPVLDALAAASGIEIRFRTDPDIQTFTLKLEHGLYDVAFMNPQHYSALVKSRAYVGMVTDTSRPLVGLIVTNRAAGITTLAELANREVCLPGKESFGATRLPLRALEAAGIKVSIRYVGSHDSVYRLVAAGQCAAGGGVARTLALTPSETHNALSVLWQSAPYPNHVIAARARLPEAARARLTAALLAMNADPIARALLADAGLQNLNRVEDRRYLTLSPLSSPARAGARP